MYPAFVGVGNSTLFTVYVAVNCPSPSPNVYTIPLIFPFPVNIHLSKFFVCFNCDVVPSLSNVTVYPFGAIGSVTGFWLVYFPLIVWLLLLPFHVPPFGFTVTVYSTSFHCADNVVADVGKYWSPIPPTLVPPVAAVNHPLNVAPVFVTLGNVIVPPV